MLLFICALVVWRNRRLIGFTFALGFMTEMLQHLFALPKHPWVAGLHALDGVAIVGLGLWLAHKAWRGGEDASGGAASAPDA